MVWKQATDCCAGTAAIYGAPDIVKISQLFSDTDVSDTVTIHECVEFTLQADAAGFDFLRVSNPAQTFEYVFLSSAIAADRNITLPLLTGNDTIVTEAHCQTLTCKTMAFACNTFTGFPESFIIAASDETTTLTCGVAKVTFHMPYAFTITDIKGSLNTASTCGVVTVDVNEGGTTILAACCKLQFDACEATTTTATCAVCITDTALANNAVITIDIDAEGTGANGLKVTLIGTQT